MSAKRCRPLAAPPNNHHYFLSSIHKHLYLHTSNLSFNPSHVSVIFLSTHFFVPLYVKLHTFLHDFLQTSSKFNTFTLIIIAIMTKLEKLYESIKNLQELGVPLNNETLQAADNLEEQLIKTEILPALSENVEPLLSQIQRDLILVVEYHPGSPISVALSRKAKITEIIDAKQLTPRPISYQHPEYEATPLIKEPHIPTKCTKQHSRRLRVTFSDGFVVFGKNSIDTYIKTLRRIGFSRVAQLGIKFADYNIVSRSLRKTEPKRVWQNECDGWYIYSNLSNEQKLRHLKTISEMLHLGLKAEDGITD